MMVYNPTMIAQDGGRRIYIHEQSFASAAAANPNWGYDASLALAGVRTAKIGHHHLIANGVELGAVRPQVADRILGSVIGLATDQLTNLLSTTGYRPNLPFRSERLLPVTSSDEIITDTCFQDGYYTFATEGAAERMYADRESMRRLRGAIGAGQGPKDLTIISGPNLIPLKRDASGNVQRDENGLVLPEEALPENPEASLDVAAANDRDLRSSLVLMLGHHLMRVYHDVGPTEDEYRIAEGFSRAQRRVLETPSFH